MTVATQIEVVNRIVNEAYNNGELAVLDECISPDFTSEMLPAGMPGGPEAFKRMISHFRTGFPDLHFTVDDQISEPGKVVNRWTMTGTHDGPYMDIPATGNAIHIHGISIWYLHDDKVVDFWVVMDQQALHHQLKGS